jgi:hypothetical protein
MRRAAAAAKVAGLPGVALIAYRAAGSRQEEAV